MGPVQQAIPSKEFPSGDCVGLPSATSQAWVRVPPSAWSFQRFSVEISNACISGGGAGFGFG